MAEEKKEESCSTKKGCGCCCGMKLLAGLIIGAFIFAAGMWFAWSHCGGSCAYGHHQYCPFSAPKAVK
ncbi:MAG: hypothetical protein KGJ09_00920 [Candidatus Omnitrophica bacterium]|nr:hypothetical protein [Candidatus Omnitrophota bacterium]MDE2008623.1 hypothetical protein [Candidatus Omnitrophota bacterium]MDE2214089.1 hypothetical protein [Candidatus Omnitrophota bacterium]MDE2230933.1 hypothetical protein [Candidatus Omnitrophota bacterium]